MRKPASLLLLAVLAAFSNVAAAVAEPVEVVFGSEIRRLQELVDRRYGRGRIDVTRDFIGAHAGDRDPWCWIGDFGAVSVKMLQRNRNVNVTGWYLECMAQPVLPQGAGSLFSGPPRAVEEAVVILPGACARFGFYIEAGGAGVGDEGATRRFFTNHSFNERWSYPQGTIRPPFTGSVQALVFDVSRWVGHESWLVCFEDLDATGFTMVGNGGNSPPGPRDDEGGSRVPDNDFDDAVFEVSAEGTTSARTLSFGSLKLRYR
jgi:hypothetical protein